MRLVGYAVIRARMEHAAAGSEHGGERVHVRVERLHVLDHVDREDQVELAVRARGELQAAIGSITGSPG